MKKKAPAKPKVAKQSFELLSFEDADKRCDLALSANFQGRYSRVIFFEGNTIFGEDLLKAVSKLTKETIDQIIVHGDLTVKGRIALYENTPGLYVSGTTRAQTLEGGDCEIYVQDGTFEYLVYGYYNDGILETGNVTVPWIINSNHDLRVMNKGARTVDNYDDDDDCEFGSDNISESFVKSVLDEDGTGLQVDAFLKYLMKGKPVLKTGANSGTDKALSDVFAAIDKRVTSLDLQEKKLKAFPTDVLKMPWLVELRLDGNAIKKIPADIRKLTKLEALSVRDCDLADLPDAVGELKALRVLNVSSNGRHVDDGGEDLTYVPIKLPDAIGKLCNLEELDVSALSDCPDVKGERLPPATKYVLPESVSRLTKLRRIVADQTNLVFPKSMWGLASVEEIILSGSSAQYLKEFPEGLSSFPNLKRLNLSSNFILKFPTSFSQLKNLEILDLSNALGCLETMPDLSSLPKLRVLRVSGNTDRTNVPVPMHDVLRPLFSMKLPALEELDVDRWGAQDKGGRPPLPPGLLAGIGTFRALKKIDLAFDSLTRLPDEFFELPALEEIGLEYNALDATECARITKAFPSARIDLRHQKGDDDSGRKLLRASLEKLRNLVKDGKSKTTVVREAELLLKQVPPVWKNSHVTDISELQRDVVIYAANLIARDIYESGGDLERARELGEHGVACVDEDDNYKDYDLGIYDTLARVLLKLGRLEDAWRIVRRAVKTNKRAERTPLKDLVKDKRYKAWLASAS